MTSRSPVARRDATLLVDDAHGFGVLGATGAGAVEEAGLSTGDVPVLMCTLGKAVGTFGAFIAGSEVLIESLIQRARTYIYTTALPPAVAAATRAALRVMREEPDRRARVLGHAAAFRTGAASLGLSLMPSRTPIQPLLVGDETQAIALNTALLERGIWVPAIRPPTVPAGTSRLRFTFSAAHTSPTLTGCSTRSASSQRAACWIAVTHDEGRAGTARRIARLRPRPRPAARLGLARRHVGALARLSSRHARLHVVDLPGHGRSAWPWTPGDLARSLVRFQPACHPGRRCSAGRWVAWSRSNWRGNGWQTSRHSC